MTEHSRSQTTDVALRGCQVFYQQLLNNKRSPQVIGDRFPATLLCRPTRKSCSEQIVFMAARISGVCHTGGYRRGFHHGRARELRYPCEVARAPRRSYRYAFTATAQVKELGSGREQVAITRDLSAGGCFVQTTSPLPTGSRIHVRIEHDGAEFSAIGRVTDNVSAIGMGIEFVEVQPKDREVLQEWLGNGKSR